LPISTLIIVAGSWLAVLAALVIYMRGKSGDE
jgi:hypothetical protein